MRRMAVLALASLLLIGGSPPPAAGQREPVEATSGAPVGTPVGGVEIVPAETPLLIGGCTVAPRPPEEREGLVAALAGFRCPEDGRRRDVTVELWQRDGSGWWRPVAETAETFATTPGMGGTPHPTGPRRGLPLGPDRISCRATPLGIFREYRTYVAAFGPSGEPLLHAGPIVPLPRDCLAGMDEVHLALAGLPPGSSQRERLPPPESLAREAYIPACPAFMLSARPFDPSECPGG